VKPRLEDLGFTVKYKAKRPEPILPGTDLPGDVDEDEAEYHEGRASYRKHRRLERNPVVVKNAKKRFISRNRGRLFCEVCKIDFEKRYGTRGRGFIEGHHKKPVAKMRENDKTRIEDIGMVCSNCHRMIHRRPAVSIEELASIVTRSQARGS
jgi:predicted HNH restriction endonuclease